MNNEPYMTEEPNTPTPSEPASDSVAKKAASSVFDIVEMIAWSVFVVLILFSFALRLCRVDGGSMENTLYNGENLILYNLGYTPKQDDIIVFNLTGRNDKVASTLVKRVIATEGQLLEIDFKTGVIKVDGKEYADSHAVFKQQYNNSDVGHYILTAVGSPYYDYATNTLTVQIPEGKLFVMGDNRNNSKDSRDPVVGLVDERWVLGKVILRISPFTLFQ